MTRRTSSCGQAYVVTILFLVVLLGMAAAVLDVGSWYRAHRSMQATADAAALAGAQALPEDPGEASALASEYAAKNGGGSMTVGVSTKVFANDTIKVEGTRPAPGFFSKVFGLDSITVRASATARAGYPTQVKYVAPIVVDEKHEKLQCGANNPCPGATELVYQHLKANGSPDGAGNFGFINLTGENGVGTSQLGEWIANGFDQYMPVGEYNVVTGNQFSSTHIGDMIDARVGDVLLFPIYRKLSGSGTNAKYEIVGWAGFRVSGIDVHGNNEKLFGEFVSVTWEGIEAESASGAPANFGVKTVSLVD
jgi:Flp pilus assembly protein TadG